MNSFQSKTNKWLAWGLLFLGIAASFAAMFQGSIFWLCAAVVFLAGGIWFLRAWLSGPGH